MIGRDTHVRLLRVSWAILRRQFGLAGGLATQPACPRQQNPASLPEATKSRQAVAATKSSQAARTNLWPHPISSQGPPASPCGLRCPAEFGQLDFWLIPCLIIWDQRMFNFFAPWTVFWKITPDFFRGKTNGDFFEKFTPVFSKKTKAEKPVWESALSFSLVVIYVWGSMFNFWRVHV